MSSTGEVLFESRMPKKNLQLSKSTQLELEITKSMSESNNLPEKNLENFVLPFVDPTRSDILKGLFFFDKIEFLLLIISFFVTKYLFQPMVGLSMLSSPLLTYWGLIGLIIFCYRHSSMSIFGYLAHRALVEKELIKGNFRMEFRLTGIIISFVLYTNAYYYSILS